MTIYGRTAGKEPQHIKTYDFTRPDKFTRGQITTMSLIHERFAREIGFFLSDFLCTRVSATIRIIDQLCFAEFNDMVPDNPLISINSMHPLPRTQLLQIDQVLTDSIVTVLGGGPLSTPGSTGKEASQLDCMLMQPIVQAAADSLQKCWWFVDNLRITNERTETRLDHAQILPPTAMIIMVELEITIDDMAGCIRLVYPFELLEPLLKQLDPLYWHRLHHQGRLPAESTQAALNSERLEFETRLRLILPEISVAEAAELKPGSRIEIPDTIAAEITAGRNTIISGEIDLVQQPLHELSSIGFDIPAAEHAVSVNEQLESGFRSMSLRLEEALTQMSTSRSADHNHQSVNSEDPGNMPSEALDPDQTFGKLSIEHINSLQQFLSSEHSQSTAAILSLLASPLTAEYLNRCNTAARKDILFRIIHSGSCSDHALHCYARFLDRSIRADKTHTGSQAGVEKVAEILSYAPRNVERELIHDWDETEPLLSEELKKRLFVFEDIVMLDPGAIQKLLNHISHAELAQACKQTDPVVLHYFKMVLPEGDYTEFEQHLSGLGPLRIRDVEAAQQRIVILIKELTGNGEIVIAREGEMTE